MQRFVKILGLGVLILIALVFLIYVCLPAPRFPSPPPDATQSMEEADTETPLKKAYFTNYTRAEVLKHYQDQFKGYWLNYPPEEAQTLIRDQTRSTFLEEIVHPLRESFFVNGFKPSQAKDEIWYKGVHYEQKITVKYVPSNLWVRILVLGLSFVGTSFLAKAWLRALKQWTSR